jgi:hypothetical protein
LLTLTAHCSIPCPPFLPGRDKVRSLHEAIQKLDKYRNIVTRKRQRATDASSAPDKLGPAGPSSSSSGALRMGAQNNSSVLSKRVRSSLADARVRVLSPLFRLSSQRLHLLLLSLVCFFGLQRNVPDFVNSLHRILESGSWSLKRLYLFSPNG